MGQLVTVCIATYNRDSFLPKAIASVLQQTYTNIELIIVDDCSKDHTANVVSNFQKDEPRIKYIRHADNKGLAAARNTAINAAEGVYFTFIDDDDTWDVNFIEEFVNLAGEYDENWCFCCGYIRKGKLGQTSYRSIPLDGKLLKYCMQGYAPPVASQFYFTSSLRKVGGYNEKVKSGVDHDLWLRLAFNDSNIKALPKYLAYLGGESSLDRKQMTKQYDKRINGITNSLHLWKNDIVSYCGGEFYSVFSKSYLLREKKELFRESMYNLNIKQSFLLYQDIREYISINEVINNLMSTLAFIIGIKITKNSYSVVKPTIKLIQPKV